MILLATLTLVVLTLILRVYKMIVYEQLSNEADSTKINDSTATGYLVSKEIKLYRFVNSHKLKSVFIFIFVFLLCLANISAHKSIWTSNTSSLSLEEKQNSVIFQNLRGSNCINEFATLSPILNRAHELNYNYSDIANLLGEPDEKLDNGDLIKYKLFPSKVGCTGNIRFSNGKVVSFSIENCK